MPYYILPPYTDEELFKEMKKAGVEDFLQSMPRALIDFFMDFTPPKKFPTKRLPKMSEISYKMVPVKKDANGDIVFPEYCNLARSYIPVPEGSKVI